MSHSLSGATQRKKRLALLQQSLNKCRLDLSLKKIKTAREVLSFLDVPTVRFPSLALDEPLTINAYNVHIAQPLENTLREILKKEADDERGIKVLVDSGSSKPSDSPSILSPTSSTEDEPRRVGLPNLIATYPVTLYRHQILAAQELKQKLLVENKRAALLQAGVGTGKTFIYGAFLAELWQTGYFEGKTFSPWPALIITKASIVEQTKRVLENFFGLCPIRQFKVMNFDALRSGKGLDSVIEKKKEVINGEQVMQYKWKPFLNPLCLIVDECQSAKNEDSTQSQIIQNVSDITDKNIKIIFSSATPFTRVFEAKYLAVNLGMHYQL
jgi:hypothetical protein